MVHGSNAALDQQKCSGFPTRPLYWTKLPNPERHGSIKSMWRTILLLQTGTAFYQISQKKKKAHPTKNMYLI
jgi:hypothetical protein